MALAVTKAVADMRAASSARMASCNVSRKHNYRPAIVLCNVRFKGVCATTTGKANLLSRNLPPLAVLLCVAVQVGPQVPVDPCIEKRGLVGLILGWMW